MNQKLPTQGLITVQTKIHTVAKEQQFFNKKTKQKKLIQLIKNKINTLKVSLEELKHLKNSENVKKEEITQEFLHQQHRNQDIKSDQIDFLNETKITGATTFTYKILYENSTFQEKQCQAIAIDSLNDFMIAGCSKDIKIFELHDDKFKLLQIAKHHAQNIKLLLFMKMFNDFISVGEDQMMCIWSYITQNQQHEVIQTISCQDIEISCLAIDFENKYLVVGCVGDFSKLKFFKKFNQKWMFDFKISIQGKIKNMCFNSLNDILISTSDEGLYIFQKSNSLWSQSQIFYAEKFGTQIFFMNNNQFAIQSKNGKQLFIYEKCDVSKDNGKEIIYFSNIKQINLSHNGQFPIRYLEEKNLIVTKDDLSINLIKKQLNGEEYNLQEKIVLDGCLGEIGDVSFDGLYFITWSLGAQKFQVRKLEAL